MSWTIKKQSNEAVAPVVDRIVTNLLASCAWAHINRVSPKVRARGRSRARCGTRRSAVPSLPALCGNGILMGGSLEVAELLASVMPYIDAGQAGALLILAFFKLTIAGRFTLEIGRFKLEVCGKVWDRR